MGTVEQDGAKLAEARAEHKAVAELTKKEASYVQALEKVSSWSKLKLVQRLLVLSFTGAFLLCYLMIMTDFMLSEKFCFRRFSIADSIGAPYELGGLENNALNIVMMPMGWVALCLAFFGFVLNWIFGKWMDVEANLVLSRPIPYITGS